MNTHALLVSLVPVKIKAFFLSLLLLSGIQAVFQIVLLVAVSQLGVDLFGAESSQVNNFIHRMLNVFHFMSGEKSTSLAYSIIIFCFLLMISRFASVFLSNFAIQLLSRELTDLHLHRLVNRDYSYFMKKSRSDIISTVTFDLNVLVQYYTTLLSCIFPTLVFHKNMIT